MQPANHNAILTRDEVAGWLKVRPRQVERLGIPCIDLGRKTKRYLANDVLAWLQAKRVDGSAHKGTGSSVGPSGARGQARP
jgi:hypothetical protein